MNFILTAVIVLGAIALIAAAILYVCSIHGKRLYLADPEVTTALTAQMLLS